MRLAESFERKQIATTIGISTIYGLLIAGILLMPVFFSMRASVSPRSPPRLVDALTSTLTATESPNDYGRFGGNVCYEQYDDQLKCVKDAGIRSQADLDIAESNRCGYALASVLLQLGGGVVCTTLAIYSIREVREEQLFAVPNGLKKDATPE